MHVDPPLLIANLILRVVIAKNYLFGALRVFWLASRVA